MVAGGYSPLEESMNSTALTLRTQETADFMQPRSYAMIVKITAKRQVTLPAHVLDEMAVAQATGFNSYQAPTDTFSVPGASTTRAWELYGRRFRGAIRPSTSAHSATSPMTQLCGTD